MPEKLVSPPSKDSSDTSDVECRVYERHTCELRGHCQPTASRGESAEPRWSATIIDISRGGIRLRLRRRFERGAILAFELKGANATQSCTAVAKVIHVRAQGEGAWIMGCKFCNQLGDEELQGLLTSMQPETSSLSERPTVVTRRAAVTRMVKLPPRKKT
jgi:hypothetical protein